MAKPSKNPKGYAPLSARAQRAVKATAEPSPFRMRKGELAPLPLPVKEIAPTADKKPPRSEALALVKTVAKATAFAGRLAEIGKGSPVVLDHVTPRAYGFAAALVALAAKPKSRLWFVCAEPKIQDLVHAELAVWQMPALYFPKQTTQATAEALPDPNVVAERVSVLSRLSDPKSESRMLVLCVDSLYEVVPALRDVEGQRRFFQTGERLDVDAFTKELEKAGYERVPQVTERGQFARRGGILDLYAWQADEPLRIELFDEEIESLRAFDLNDQGSVRRLERASFILQLSDATGKQGRVADYLKQGDIVVAIECEPKVPVQVVITTEAARREGAEDFASAIHDNPLGTFDASDFVLHEARRQHFDAQVMEWKREGWRTVLFFHNAAERERFHELLSQDKAAEMSIETQLGMLYRGFTVPAAKLAVITGAEIFGRHQVVRRAKGSKLDEAQVLRHARELIKELNEHDLVVHAEYGVAKYGGIEVRGEGAQREEVLVLRYADQAKLYVPTAQAHLVSRYVGVGGSAPSLNKLGDKRWGSTRKNAERSVEEFAAHMITIAAERQSVKGTPHQPDTKWQAEFEGSFVYQETPDQLRCVEEIKRDMESERPMDRLLCADVGFGKTEVAIRAAFKAVMGGRQVAILVPTTVLAAQHWKTLRERMSEFPVTVEMLCRLTPPDKEREIIKGLKDGSVDIVVGTHRVISKDVIFKDLGLAVVDEEQRFGVKHKEKFKELFRLTDVLTLSATPIPRTLYLALMGMRDMSTIETPPPNRQSVQTTICPYDERVIKAAVNAEVERNGQVFFLHNRVGDIDAVKAKIMGLCPRARVVVGHGQMDEGLLEAAMHKFVNGDADVLVCTTIIESGVDVPNANTIIIDRADRFGLADLYQLRGRVGRSDVRAQAYLMLPRDFVTGGDARKRVNAIKQYTALGSGFKIAMRDLEIRGAGNLLGTEQSGHIAAVGFDLYCQMLKQAVNRSQGKRTQRPVDVPLRADFLCLSESAYNGALPGLEPAFIPGDYMEDPKLRIQGYRAVAEVTMRRDIEDLERAWKDQFGRPPPAIANLLLCAAIRLAATSAKVSSVEIKDHKLMLKLGDNYVLIQGKFPRLTSEDGVGQLREALQWLRSL
ncbi:MAG: mfd [Verrucomicrobiaceae bacterium]|nr:mfd [Verrucomicrobiaceae bacterium]